MSSNDNSFNYKPLDTKKYGNNLFLETEKNTQRNIITTIPPPPKEPKDGLTNSNTLRPIKVILRNTTDETPQTHNAIIQEINEQRKTIRQRMKDEIITQKHKYEKLDQRPKHPDPTNNIINNRVQTLIEDRIRKKTLQKKTQENFTSPGKILNQQEELLYSNKFDSTTVLEQDHSRQFKQKFRRYYENKRSKEEQLNRLNTGNNDLIKTNNYKYALTPQNIQSVSNIGPGDITSGNQLTNPHNDDRYNKPRSTLVSIDSKDRDIVRYPNPNSFKISLGKQFRNVKRVSMISSEFPNTDLVVRDDPQEAVLEKNKFLIKCGEILNDANNHIYWINDEDATMADMYNCLFYTINLSPGNYSPQESSCNCKRSLETEIEEKVVGVNRFIDGTPHQFIVNIDPSTNIVRFLSIESGTLAVDPIATTIGTNIITVSHPGHGLAVGDVVTLTGSTSVGGISAAVINGERIIVSITENTYTIRVTQIANSTTTGGGANVLAGQNKPIKLLFSNIDTVGSLLGFPQEDSSDQIATDIEFIDIDPTDLSITPLDPNPNTPGVRPARILATNHGLLPGDEILIIDTDTIPDINGIQRVTNIISLDEFEIGVPIKVVNNQTVTQNTILGQICYSLTDTYTGVTGLTTQIMGNIQTGVTHGFALSDSVYIGNVENGLTLDGNTINGIQTVSGVIDTTHFDIDNGILFEGTDISNAYVFETSSTTVTPITSLIPKNNGVIEPSPAEPVFIGSQKPDYVFFKNMGNINPDINGETSGILQVDYYSETSGKFDLTTPIANIFSQTAGQQYIRSSDAAFRTITDAFVQSKGTIRLDVPHNLNTGNRIYIRSLIPEVTTSETRITPDITGILTVNTILDSQNFDTTTEIITSIFDTGDIAYIPTEDKTGTRIQNIYPNSNNYIAKNINACKNTNCTICEDTSIIIADSYLRVASGNVMAAVSEETTSVDLLNGIRTVSQVFKGQSQNFTHILDLTDVILDVLPINIETVAAPIGVGVVHTITMFYDFSSIMLDDPTTGKIIFGGTGQLGLATDTEYNFEYSPSAGDNEMQLRITTPLTNIGPISVGPLLPGTFYIKTITFDSATSYKSPLGNCFVLETEGVSQGTNGLNGIGSFEEIGDGLIQITTTYAHGLANGDIIYVFTETPQEPELPWLVENILAGSGAIDATLEFDFPAYDIQITKPSDLFNFAQYQIDGNVLGDGTLLIPDTEDTATQVITSTSLISIETYPINQLPARFTITPESITGIQIGDPGRRVQIPIINSPGAPEFIISFTSKNINYLENKSFTVSIVNTTTFQISIGTIGRSGFIGEIEYAKICGGGSSISSYFANSWPGLLESQNNLLTNTNPTNIYIGKSLEAGTTPTPIDIFAIPTPVNGFLGNTLGAISTTHPFSDPLNFHFFTSTDLFNTPIVKNELNATHAEFVKVDGNSEILANINEITPANTGLLESMAPHGFVGGERLYFLGNVNINNGVSNDLRESFFEVTDIDPTNDRRFTINVPITVIGNGNVGAIAEGNFFKTPPDETEHSILNISRQTNAVFFSDTPHAFDPVVPTQIFITNNTLTPTNDVFGNAISFPNPAPIPNTTQFDSDIIVLPNDIGTALANNKVDIVNTDNTLFPKLKNMSWVKAQTSYKIPITDIVRDSNGSLSPVHPDLSVGDTIFIKSTHTTTQDLNGFHQISYIDLVAGTFFELNGAVLTNIGNALSSAEEIVYFKVPDANACVTINDITEGQCPTIVRASDHGFPIGSNISVFICDTQTDNPIDYTSVNIINDAIVLDNDEIQLPTFNNGNINANLCVDTVFNDTNLFIEQHGRFSKKILSTNCGEAVLSPDPINHQTFVTTNVRQNIKTKLMFSIDKSTPTTGGASIITIVLSQGYTAIPWSNGDTVQISGHIGGDPYITGEFKIFNVSTTQFSIIPRPDTTIFSTGGTGGYATGPAPPYITGHGLVTGDKVKFEHVKSTPSLNDEVFQANVIDATTFTIPTVVDTVDNRCPGTWCSNIIDMELRDHGLVDGDTFFLYGAESTGGIQPADLNTIHGEKRMNIPTKEEIRTQKTVRVIDGNNIQFSVDAFPSARILAGGYTICISSNNHTNDEKAMGLKNYGFNPIQTNQSCLGKNRRFIDLNNESYVLMVSDKLNHLLNTGPVRKIFAKIQLNSTPGDISFNSFVSTSRIFDTPITRLDEIDFEIRRSDGKLFDLRGRDYSISLLIEEYQDKLRNTEISSRRGIPDRGAISQIGAIESTISSQNPQENILNRTQFLNVTDLTQRAQASINSNK